MENEIKEKAKNTWIQTTISIIIGVVFTVGTTWYTIYINKEESERSELERYNKVKENIVSIIEEHIVNKDSIDFISLSRIVNNRVKEENLYRKPQIYDLLSLAEYNIQNSRHLSFEKKVEYSRILSKQFKNIKIDTTLILGNIRFPEEIKNITENLNSLNSQTGKKSLTELIKKYENEISDLQIDKRKKDTFSDYLFKSPTRIILILISYVSVILLFFYYRKIRRRKNYLNSKKVEILDMESHKIKDEIDYLISKVNNPSTSETEKSFINDRIEYLFDKIKNIDIDYR
jgi:hypothetical protein